LLVLGEPQGFTARSTRTGRVHPACRLPMISSSRSNRGDWTRPIGTPQAGS